MNKKYLIALVLTPFLLTGCKLKLPSVNQDESVKSTPPAEALDESGDINEEKFEEAQKVSDDTSLEQIEKELNETIILKEDFSDL